jgi:ABC-type amino acid transport substrate-binding protein
MSFKKLLPLATLLLPLMPLTAAAAGALRVGGFVVAPIVLGNAGAPLHGALRDYLEQEVVARGVALEWTPATSLPRAIENLKSGAIDILLVTSERYDHLPEVAMFNWSYLRTQPHLAVRSDAPLQAVQSLQQLAGMEIGWVGGTTVPVALQSVPIQWKFLSVPDWQSMNMRKLKAGRIQAVFFENGYSPRYFAASEHVDIKLLKLPMPERHFTMAYSAKADPAAIARFNKVAGTAFANEQFKAYLDQYMRK